MIFKLFEFTDFKIKMQIRNTSRNSTFGNKIKLCYTPLSKFIGLMFSKKSDVSLIFKFSHEKIVPLHMIFVFYPIDVLFLNKEKVVVELKENFRPFTFYTPRKKAMYVIEMPENSIKKLKAEVGDKIKF